MRRKTERSVTKGQVALMAERRVCSKMETWLSAFELVTNPSLEETAKKSRSMSGLTKLSQMPRGLRSMMGTVLFSRGSHACLSFGRAGSTGFSVFPPRFEHLFGRAGSQVSFWLRSLARICGCCGPICAQTSLVKQLFRFV